MGNFWNTFELWRVRSDFEEILEDGFDTIIFVVPWAHLQPRIHPIAYDEVILSRLRHLIASARSVGLRVMLRLGYLWENSRANIPTYRRYQQLFTEPRMMSAWRDYLRTIERLLGDDADTCDLFISWEDVYWPILRHPENQALEGRVKHAREIGFTDYLGTRLPGNLLQRIYGLDAASLDMLPAPLMSEKLFAEFVLFFDRRYVEPWVLATKDALSRDIWYEHRIDPDVCFGEGWQDSIEHSGYKAGSSCDVVYYHPKIGVSGAKPLDLKTAVQHVKRVLTGFRAFNIHKRPLFLDQFNFKIDNPKHPDFARLSDELVPEFLEQLVPVFRKNLFGYGTWGYRDWRDDKIFNGSFELELQGWEGEAVVLQKSDGGNAALLQAGSALVQKDLPGMPLLFIEFLPLPEDAALTFSNGIQVEVRLISEGATTMEVAFRDSPNRSDLTITCSSGSVAVRKVAYYSHIFTNGLRDIHGRPSEVFSAIVKFNRALSAGPLPGARRS